MSLANAGLWLLYLVQKECKTAFTLDKHAREHAREHASMLGSMLACMLTQLPEILLKRHELSIKLIYASENGGRRG